MNIKKPYCIGLNCYDNNLNKGYNTISGEVFEKDFNNYCENFSIYPTIIPHKERVIAIGDIHGDMNLAINFLKVAKVIEEVNIKALLELKIKKHFIKEYIYTLNIKKKSIISLNESIYNKHLYSDIADHIKNQIEVVYRYYQIDNEYYVKIIQEDNNPLHLDIPSNIIFDNNRWFKWIGKKTYVVQVGDQIDRCRPWNNNNCNVSTTTINDEDSDLEIMLLYDSLDKIAQKVGGRLFSLLGNHEIMNIKGDMRYVSYKGVKEFSPPPLSKDYKHGKHFRINKFKTIISKKMACTRSTILVIGDYLFVHGGIVNELAYSMKMIDINSIIRKFLHGSAQYSKILQKLLDSSKYSPLWYRKLAFIPEDIDGIQHADCNNIYDPIIQNLNSINTSTILSNSTISILNKSNGNKSIIQQNKNLNNYIISSEPTIQIKGMIIGHTPQFTVFEKGITTACNNKIIRVDIGASSAFDKFAPRNEARETQVIEIITDLETKISKIKILK